MRKQWRETSRELDNTVDVPIKYIGRNISEDENILFTEKKAGGGGHFRAVLVLGNNLLL